MKTTVLVKMAGRQNGYEAKYATVCGAVVVYCHVKTTSWTVREDGYSVRKSLTTRFYMVGRAGQPSHESTPVTGYQAAEKMALDMAKVAA